MNGAPWEVVCHGSVFRVRQIVDGRTQFRQSASGRITNYKTEAAAKREAKALNKWEAHAGRQA